MPSPFFIYEEPITNEQILRAAAQEKQARESLLAQFQNQSGPFTIKFPNNKVYVGHSKNIADRLSRILRDFFAPARKKNNYVNTVPKWIQKAKEENDIRGIADLEIYFGEDTKLERY